MYPAEKGNQGTLYEMDRARQVAESLTRETGPLN